jgi:cytochrome P450 family 49 subfamily A
MSIYANMLILWPNVGYGIVIVKRFVLNHRHGCVSGHYDIQKLDKIMWQLYRDYGKIVRLGGLLGHPDLLFVFDASLVEQVFRREEHMPHRPSMPSLHHYKNVLRKDFFGDTPGVIGV